MVATSRSGRILIVDDDARLLRTLQILLEDEGGHQIVTAGTVTQALEHLEQDPAIALALVDYALPDGDGIALLNTLRQKNVSIPTLLMTAHDDPHIRRAAYAAGAAAFLIKPVDPDLLLSSINRSLQPADHRR